MSEYTECQNVEDFNNKYKKPYMAVKSGIFKDVYRNLAEKSEPMLRSGDINDESKIILSIDEQYQYLTFLYIVEHSYLHYLMYENFGPTAAAETYYDHSFLKQIPEQIKCRFDNLIVSYVNFKVVPDKRNFCSKNTTPNSYIDSIEIINGRSDT
jgi:hypothetical protein